MVVSVYVLCISIYMFALLFRLVVSVFVYAFVFFCPTRPHLSSWTRRSASLPFERAPTAVAEDQAKKRGTRERASLETRCGRDRRQGSPATTERWVVGLGSAPVFDSLPGLSFFCRFFVVFLLSFLSFFSVFFFVFLLLSFYSCLLDVFFVVFFVFFVVFCYTSIFVFRCLFFVFLEVLPFHCFLFLSFFVFLLPFCHFAFFLLPCFCFFFLFSPP